MPELAALPFLLSQSLVSLQLPLSEIRFFAIGIELPNVMPVQRSITPTRANIAWR